MSELSGSALSLLTLVRGLRADPAWKLHVAVGEGGWLADRLGALGVASTLINHPRLSSRRGALHQLRYISGFASAVASFARLCTAVGPSLVHLNSSVSPFALLGARRARVPAVVHCREVPGSRLVRTVLWRFTEHFAAGIIANSRFAASTFGRSPKIHVVYNGFDLPAGPSGPAGFKRVLVVSRLSADKGADLALRAFAQILAEEPDAQLDVVGGAVAGHERFLARVRHLADTAPLRGHVTLHGAQEDVGPFFRRSDLLLHLPRYEETFGRVLVEAAAHALPSVAFANGGIPEIVETGVSGFLIDQGDVEGAAARCVELLRDRGLAMRLGSEARRQAQERFSVARHIEGVTAVYRSLIGPRS
ncbi:MAG: glycosyltransferase family 4 protein [Thermoanaerobaculales bacterium]